MTINIIIWAVLSIICSAVLFAVFVYDFRSDKWAYSSYTNTENTFWMLVAMVLGSLLGLVLFLVWQAVVGFAIIATVAYGIVRIINYFVERKKTVDTES